MTSAVIVAAGKGTRMGPGIDKLFLKCAGKPIIAHTWLKFDQTSCIGHIVLVVRDGMQDTFRQLASEYGLLKPFEIVTGGKERQDSVWNGIQALPQQCEIVAIHDGARPCVTRQLIEKTVQTATTFGAAVASQRVIDTIKVSRDGKTICSTPQRTHLWAVQTPQTFQVEIIKKALTQVRNQGILVTDDTAACEYIQQPVYLVESEQPNPKATSQSDIPYLEHLLQSKY